MNKSKKSLIIISAIVVLLLLTLSFIENESLLIENRELSPRELNDGWKVSTLKKEGFNVGLINELEDFYENDKHGDLQSVAVFRNNKIVYEKYFNYSSSSGISDIRSATKSLTSALIGIAIDQGFISSVDEKILPYFSDYFPLKELDEKKQNITIRDLLTMTAGFDSDDWTNEPYPEGCESNLLKADDWVRFSIDIPMLHEPGEIWAYSSMNSFLLGYILEKATGQQFEDFAQKYLFDPLGINNIKWSYTQQRRVIAQGNFYISSRDMGKFGQLYLDEGLFNGKQIISKEWVAESTAALYPLGFEGYYYGYQWWLDSVNINEKTIPLYFASGNGGNYICIVSEYDTVITIRSTAYSTDYGNSRSNEIVELILGNAEEF